MGREEYFRVRDEEVRIIPTLYMFQSNSCSGFFSPGGEGEREGEGACPGEGEGEGEEDGQDGGGGGGDALEVRRRFRIGVILNQFIFTFLVQETREREGRRRNEAHVKPDGGEGRGGQDGQEEEPPGEEVFYPQVWGISAMFLLWFLLYFG